MALSIEQLGEIDHIVGQWCLQHVPPELKAQVDYDYEIDGQAVILLEVRPVWRGPPGEKSSRAFAKLRYVKSRQYWQLYWMRANGNWFAYDPVPSALTLAKALDVMASDRYGCFFG